MTSLGRHRGAKEPEPAVIITPAECFKDPGEIAKSNLIEGRGDFALLRRGEEPAHIDNRTAQHRLREMAVDRAGRQQPLARNLFD